jgi:hypothetical protein
MFRAVTNDIAHVIDIDTTETDALSTAGRRANPGNHRRLGNPDFSPVSTGIGADFDIRGGAVRVYI